ncbi:serine C-palmitoyltransferase LCB1 [Kluyveromyces lactis]|uniref:serine C-palmitoyltransferase n=1 Tax=Kluyveromyces lactis (strain ATCC 8585 / CBS 2359 / DSM 70799 / NBRC 1267 / NRRL Y-1140 / WM37) TaxID=284590 RepID=Q6CXA4_KLULA|nr:uncharacterized protein KLLA0_A09955g [Kluyveromyces lactis]CAH03023.1 KLLA0A09955p [Kluyveromyces lactis]|eukprot:XP_451435.1 uncharacterized protein KLLA0_A09955g [Kluyveromyces lactis]
MIDSVNVPEVLPSSIPVPSAVISSASYLWFYFITFFKLIPGAHYVIDYVEKSHQDDPYRTFVEVLLILYSIVYFLSKPKKKGAVDQPKLSEKEIDNLIEEWEPEPIVVPDERNEWRLAKIPVIEGSGADNVINITRDNGKEAYASAFNLCSFNFLQLSKHPRVVEIAKEIIKNYGVGSCGPAGFYGNEDVHYNLEYDLASFFGTENSVLYGQDFCVSSSVIPAFTKRGDVIVADDKISVSSQNALQLSRSTVYYYKHNDMASLENLLHELDEAEKKEKLPAIPRKFIVTEGIFHRTGEIAPLPELVQLKRKYKYRLFIDETFSIGVLGATGRGLTEYYNINRATSIDITVGSLATAIGSSGGFVLGDNVMVRHQRIGSNAYCFSASLPPYAVRTASTVLQMMDEDNSSVTKLRYLSNKLHEWFQTDTELLRYIEVTSHRDSSVLHFQLTDAQRQQKFGSSIESVFQESQYQQQHCISDHFVESWEKEEIFLQAIVDTVLIDGNILISRDTIVLKQETLPVTPNISICCNSSMEESQLLDAYNVIRIAIIKHCSEA